MSLTQDAKGKYLIRSQSDFAKAVQQFEDDSETLVEIEEQIEEEYGYTTIQKGLVSLKEAIDAYMIDKKMDKVDRPNFRLTVIRAKRTYWNADKLKAIVGKSTFLKVCDLTVNKDKIDDMCRKGTLDENEIAPALEEVASKPYVKVFKKDGGAADEEEQALKGAMS